MRKIFNLKYLVIILLVISCQSNSKSSEKDLLEREKELLKKEKEILIKENELLKKEGKKEIIKERIIEKKIVEKKKFVVSKTIVEKEFKKNIGKIEDSSSETFINDVFIGDLNEDGLNDGLVYYRKEAYQGGSGTTGNGLAIFLNKGNNLYYLFKDEELHSFSPEKIASNTIFGQIAEYGPDDPNCCPSIITKVKLQLFPGQKLLQIP